MSERFTERLSPVLSRLTYAQIAGACGKHVEALRDVRGGRPPAKTAGRRIAFELMRLECARMSIDDAIASLRRRQARRVS